MIHIKRFLYWILTSVKPHKSKTVRYAFPVTFLSFILIGAATILSDQSSMVRIETNKTALKAGDEFTIEVYADTHVPVNAVDIQVTYPKDSVKIKSIDAGRSVITLWAVDPYFENGTIYLQGGTFRRGFLGKHLIVSIKAQAVTSGVAQFSVNTPTLLAGDGSGKSVSLDKSSNALSLLISDTNLYGDDMSVESLRTLESRVVLSITTDIDGDGKVTMADIHAFISAWKSQQVLYDFNGDNEMTFTDFAIILADFFFRK